MLRRIITLLVLFVFEEFPIFQLQIIVCMAFMNCMYQIQFKPLISKSDNITQLINEITIYLVSVGMYLMLNVSIEINQREVIAYFVIGIISLNIMYNVSKAAYTSIIDIKNSIKGFFNSRKAQKY